MKRYDPIKQDGSKRRWGAIVCAVSAVGMSALLARGAYLAVHFVVHHWGASI